MSSDQDFKPLERNASGLSSPKRRVKLGVIKGSKSHISGTIHLHPPLEETEEGVEFFQPIYDGDTIVGVLHKCSCGKTAEIRFQYTDQKK